MDSKPDSHIWHIALMRHFVVVAPHKVRFATISPKFFWPQKMPCLDLNSILMWQKHHQGRTSKVTFCNVFLTNRKVAQDITPPKTKMAFWTNHHLLIGDAASNGCISIAILIFWEYALEVPFLAIKSLRFRTSSTIGSNCTTSTRPSACLSGSEQVIFPPSPPTLFGGLSLFFEKLYDCG